MAVPELSEFRPEEASAAEWTAYHSFRRRRQLDESPDDPLVPDEVVERRLRRPDPYTFHNVTLAHCKGEVVGEMWASAMTPASPGYESNRHLMQGGAWVLSPQRRQAPFRLGMTPQSLLLRKTGGIIRPPYARERV